MNLHEIASGVIGIINPNEWITYYRSTGSVTAADGKRVPTFAPAQRVYAQVQNTTTDDLKRSDALNLQKATLKVWFTGAAAGVIRQAQRGGDTFAMDDGSTWLLLSVLEQWPEWCSVLLVRQHP
jgi:hypothetical protein